MTDADDPRCFDHRWEEREFGCSDTCYPPGFADDVLAEIRERMDAERDIDAQVEELRDMLGEMAAERADMVALPPGLEWPLVRKIRANPLLATVAAAAVHDNPGLTWEDAVEVLAAADV